MMLVRRHAAAPALSLWRVPQTAKEASQFVLAAEDDLTRTMESLEEAIDQTRRAREEVARRIAIARRLGYDLP